MIKENSVYVNQSATCFNLTYGADANKIRGGVGNTNISINPLTRYIFPKDVLVFNDDKYDEQLKFVVVTLSDGKHMDLLNLNDFSLEGLRCLFGDTLIELIEKEHEGFKFLKKVTLEEI
ncbi:hypothetical protein EXM90_12085 [Clostridium botulinum]|uniref:hypothetical protein n=1 Tax=Clostridium botulinum TaxID=1491 RepID=UPI0004B28D84|nr:hypothetical protein [Clostridium botulinum]MBN3351904.1 hypothetical protein [Clostridium botulinum]MBN3371752.1 hypothetical protein [Clostridium botulinum]MBN3451378.1 hypothetical protein [Clostridium botulinum]NFB64639.1 hypothetical protein [Clostridium botulinum]NFB82087.1 hypothetical protein [Clostridium botulinum]